MSNLKIVAKLGLLISLLAMELILFTNPERLAAQEANGITSPESGDVISELVPIEGTARDPSFLRYELAFYQEFSPAADWIVFAQGDQPVIDGTLAVWDTKVGYPDNPVFSDGRYRLRLRVVRTDYNYDEYYVSGLVISNETATPTPTQSLTNTQTIVATPLSEESIQGTAEAGAQPIPTLAPFPSPTAIKLLQEEDDTQAAIDPADENPSANQSGVLNQIQQVNTARFIEAFWFGAKIVLYIFAGLAAYWLFRALFRWVRRFIRSRRFR